jgi:DNA-binding HxlR family transcriptional regulator
MLTKSLQELEAHQLIIRKSYDTIPPKVEYSLSERGKSLIPLLKEFDAWGRSQIELDRKL